MGKKIVAHSVRTKNSKIKDHANPEGNVPQCSKERGRRGLFKAAPAVPPTKAVLQQ